MPKPSTKKPEKPEANGNPAIVYPTIRVNGVEIPPDKLRITQDKIKAFLGWESEEEYASRRTKENPDLAKKPEALSFGTHFLLTDEYGHKIRCHKNTSNRDFREGDCRAYAQSILKRQWRMNGETIIIGDRGSALSIQHRGIALILACQMWEKDEYWRKYWEEEPFIEGLVVTGIHEDYETIQTIDNVVPRILADTYATSGLFDDWILDKKPLDKAKRTEASKLLDAATDILWKRTGAGFDEHNKYQTHASSRDFVNRHPSIIKAAKHLFEEDQGRGISRLGIARGQCAGLCYLMGTSGSDRLAYEAMESPDETALDFSAWDDAEEFWTYLSPSPDERGHIAKTIALVLSNIAKGDYGTSELNDKKLTVLIKAWLEWRETKTVTEAGISPVCAESTSGDIVLTEFVSCGGIDLGFRPTPPDNGPTPEELKAAEEEKSRKMAEKAAKSKKTTSTEQAKSPVREAVDKIRNIHPDKVLLFRTTDGGLSAFDQDAHDAASTQGAKAKTRPADGIDQFKLSPGMDINGLAKMLKVKTGKGIILVEDDGEKMTDITPKPVAKPQEPKIENPTPTTKPTKPVKKPVAKKPALRGGV